MNLTFRQGLARYQTDISANPTFLQRSAGAGNFIDLLVQPDPTIIVFAHKTANYIVEETKTVRNAWGPFSGSQTQYLYWDVNMVTGEVTRGVTLFPPMYAGTSPVNPIVDQHWFDTNDVVMRVWNGGKWVEKIRVFAAYLSSGGIIRPYPIGSQAGITGNFEGGNIVLDSYNKPLRQSDGTFVTTTTSMIIVNNSAKKIKFEAEVMSGMANEPIPQFSLVQFRAGRRIHLARSTEYLSRIAGIVTEDLYTNEPGYVTTDGLIRNETWSWPANKVNRPLFCGPNGQLTLTPPTEGVLQVAGFVYDTDAVYINIFPPIILDDVRAIVVPPPVPPTPLAPVADFYATPITGSAPLTVTFSSTSTGSPISYEWDFTNDGTIDATTATAGYTYAVPGIYSVRFKATNEYGSDEEIKNALVNVTQGAETGTYTNLGVKLGGPSQIQRNQPFNVSITVNNDGYLAATNTARTISIPDVGDEQIIVTNLPVGSTKTRSGKITVINLPVIPILNTGAVYGPMFFTVQAPSRKGALKIQAMVHSPETDATIGDNTASISIEVRP